MSIARCTMRPAPAKSATFSPLATASPPIALISSTTSIAGLESTAVAVHVAAEVVDHDLRALAGERERVLTADAAPRSGHDDDPAVADTHAQLSFSAASRSCSRSWCL